MLLQLAPKATFSFWKCLNYMSRVGRELLILCTTYGLKIQTINESASACLLINFSPSFFSAYDVERDKDELVVPLQPFLRCFRNIRNGQLERTVISKPTNTIQVQFYGEWGIVRTYTFKLHCGRWRLPRPVVWERCHTFTAMASKLSTVLCQFAPTDSNKNTFSSVEDISFVFDSKTGGLRVQTFEPLNEENAIDDTHQKSIHACEKEHYEQSENQQIDTKNEVCNTFSTGISQLSSLFTRTILPECFFEQLVIEHSLRADASISVSLSELYAVLGLCADHELLLNVSWHIPGEPLIATFGNCSIDATVTTLRPYQPLEIIESIHHMEGEGHWAGILWLSTALIGANMQDEDVEDKNHHHNMNGFVVETDVENSRSGNGATDYQPQNENLTPVKLESEAAVAASQLCLNNTDLAFSPEDISDDSPSANVRDSKNYVAKSTFVLPIISTPPQADFDLNNFDLCPATELQMPESAGDTLFKPFTFPESTPIDIGAFPSEMLDVHCVKNPTAAHLDNLAEPSTPPNKSHEKETPNCRELIEPQLSLNVVQKSLRRRQSQELRLDQWDRRVPHTELSQSTTDLIVNANSHSNVATEAAVTSSSPALKSLPVSKSTPNKFKKSIEKSSQMCASAAISESSQNGDDPFDWKDSVVEDDYFGDDGLYDSQVVIEDSNSSVSNERQIKFPYESTLNKKELSEFESCVGQLNVEQILHGNWFDQCGLW